MAPRTAKRGDQEAKEVVEKKEKKQEKEKGRMNKERTSVRGGSAGATVGMECTRLVEFD